MKSGTKNVRRRLIVLLCLAGILFLMSLCAPVLMPNDPYETHVAFAKKGPSAQYPLGTDALGRCVLSRVLAGSGTTIFSTLILVAVMTVFGTAVGAASGYAGGVWDIILMRITDFLLSFPQMVVAIVVAGILGGGMANAMIALGVTGWTSFARMARGRVLAIKEEEYIQAARLSGNRGIGLLTGYFFPNMAGPILVAASQEIGSTMVSLAGLSFLGLGAQVPAAEWGAMINEGRSMIQLAPQVVLAPAAAIFLTVTVFNLLGDTIRDAVDVTDRLRDEKTAEEKPAEPLPAASGESVPEKMPASGPLLLEVAGLTAGYGREPALRNVSLTMKPGEILGIVGESGSGKSTLLKAIAGAELFGIRTSGGEIRYQGRNLRELPVPELRKLRGEEIGVVSQEPGSFYNPIRPYEKQIRETLAAHGRTDWETAKKELLAVFEVMNLYEGEKLLGSCPCELSGGMNQRVVIAAAALLKPRLLLADEPTSALDVTVQKQILGELKRLNRETGMAMMIVTHHIGVVRELADRVVILKDGTVMESGECLDVLDHPENAYTRELIAAVPRLSFLPDKNGIRSFEAGS